MEDEKQEQMKKAIWQHTVLKDEKVQLRTADVKQL